MKACDGAIPTLRLQTWVSSFRDGKATSLIDCTAPLAHDSPMELVFFLQKSSCSFRAGCNEIGSCRKESWQRKIVPAVWTSGARIEPSSKKPTKTRERTWQDHESFERRSFLCPFLSLGPI